MNNYKEALNYYWKIYNENHLGMLARHYYDELREAVGKANKYDELNAIFDDKHICEIKSKFNKIECNGDKCDICPLHLGKDMCLKIAFEDKWNFQEENEKLKKIIKLLATKIELLISEEEPWCGGKPLDESCKDYRIWTNKRGVQISKEEYELLKEVLKND